jgi:hypothetical protein
MPHEWLTDAWLRVKALVKRRRLERDLEEELQFHLARRAEKNRTLGLGAEDARVGSDAGFWHGDGPVKVFGTILAQSSGSYGSVRGGDP